MTPIHVLLVERRSGGRSSLARRLRAKEFRVRVLAAAETGLEEIGASPPDVLIWDIGASGSKGLSLLPRIRSLSPQLPILVLASKMSVPLAREAVRQGVYRVLLTPARTNELELAIHQALDDARSPSGSRTDPDDGDRALQAILDSSLAALVMVDGAGGILAANRRVSEFFGLAREETVGEPIERLHQRVRGLAADPARFDRLVEAQRNASESPEAGAAEHYESAIRILGANPRDLMITSAPVRTHGDRAPRRVWTYVDVTRLKQADEQIHLIVDAAPIPLLVSRISDGKILYANDREAALVGLSREELLGRKSLDFYADPGERPRLMAELMAKGHLDDVEVRLRRADGEVSWSVFSLVKTELRGEPVIVSGAYDVTRRKQAEDALKNERNFVSAILETAGALVVVVDADGRVVRFNRACERITGYTFDEVRGKPFADTFLLPEERPAVERDFAKLLAGQPRLERRNCWVTRTGETRLVEWSSTTLTGEDGRVE